MSTKGLHMYWSLTKHLVPRPATCCFLFLVLLWIIDKETFTTIISLSPICLGYFYVFFSIGFCQINSVLCSDHCDTFLCSAFEIKWTMLSTLLVLTLTIIAWNEEGTTTPKRRPASSMKTSHNFLFCFIKNSKPFTSTCSGLWVAFAIDCNMKWSVDVMAALEILLSDVIWR